jgi:hypothetical protein
MSGTAKVSRLIGFSPAFATASREMKLCVAPVSMRALTETSGSGAVVRSQVQSLGLIIVAVAPMCSPRCSVSDGPGLSPSRVDANLAGRSLFPSVL